MSLKAWFAMYPGDYIRDTGSLSLVEHGAYWRLLLHCYSRHLPSIPHDRRYRVAGATHDEELAAVDCVLEEFFERDGDTWFHHRVAREITILHEKHKKLSSSGRIGARKRWGGHGEANGEANGEAIATPLANACQSQSHPHSSSLSPSQPEEEAASAAPVLKKKEVNGPCHETKTTNKSNRGRRLPADWWPDAADCTYCQQLGLDTAKTAEEFRDYWHAEAGQRASKLNWSLAWKRWCRRAAEGFGSKQRTGGLGTDNSLVVAAVKQAHHQPECSDQEDLPAWQK